MDSNSPKFRDLNRDENPLINEIDLKSLFQTFIRKKNLIIKFSFAGILLGGIFTFVQKPTWQGEFQIVLESNAEKSDLGGSGVLNQFQRNIPNIGGGLSLLGNKTDQLQTEVEILKSPSVLINVFKFIKKEKNNKTYNRLRFEKWRDKYLSVELTKKTSILNLAFKDKDKELIIPVLNQISNKYQEYSDKRRRRDIELGLKYFEEQIEINKEKSEKSNAIAQKFALEHDLTYTSGSGGSSDDNFMGNINQGPKTLNVEKSRIEAANDLKIIENQLKELKALDPESESDDVIGFANSIKGFLSPLTRALNELDMRLSELRVYYNEKDISITEILEKKIVLTNSLKIQMLSTLKGQKIEAEARLKASERPSGVLIKYSQLVSEAERDKKILDNLGNNYRKTQLEKARTRDPWELITNPMILPKPVSPKKLINLMIGLSLGFGAGITVSIISGKKEDIIYSAEQIDLLLDIPLIAELNYTKNNIEEEIFLLANGPTENLKSISFLTVGNVEKRIFEIISPLFKKYFVGDDYKLTDNPIDAIKYENIIYILLIGKTKKREIIEMKKKLQYQKNLKIGYLAIRE